MLRSHTYTAQKNNVQYLHCKNNNNNIKKTMLSCILSSFSLWPSHLIHITNHESLSQEAGGISPSTANSAMNSINSSVSTFFFHSLQKTCMRGFESYTFHLQAEKTGNVTSLMGKEPELVLEVEVMKFRRDIVGLTLTHGKGSETSLLRGGWTLEESTLEMPTVRGGGQGWQFLLPTSMVPIHWS